MTTKKLQEEMDYWVKNFNSLVHRCLDMVNKQQDQINILKDHIEDLEKYNRKTVHPNLVLLREKIK